jgi:hypothetical protein
LCDLPRPSVEERSKKSKGVSEKRKQNIQLGIIKEKIQTKGNLKTNFNRRVFGNLKVVRNMSGWKCRKQSQFAIEVG